MADGSGVQVFTDAGWAEWEPLIEEARPRGETPPKDLRRTISAILWRHQNGAKWRSSFPPSWRSLPFWFVPILPFKPNAVHLGHNPVHIGAAADPKALKIQ